MKKQLLIFTIALMPLISSAQKNSGNHQSSVCNITPLGMSPSVTGATGGSITQLWYDKDINSVAFIHRSECDTNNTSAGNYTYDLSTDAGLTWTNNRQLIYGPLLSPGNCQTQGARPGRSPKAAIYNPLGNSNPTNAHFAYTGYWSGSPNAGRVWGAGHFDLSPPNENCDTAQTLPYVLPEDIFITKTGDSWILQSDYSSDSIVILKGTWNGNDFSYTRYPVYYPANPAVGLLDMKIAFADNGMTGYIAILSNQDPNHTHFVNSASYIQVLKTIDGGQTWSCPADLDIQTSLDSALANNGSNYYMTTWDLDIVIDANDNLHIITGILEYNMQGLPLNVNYGSEGIFDVYTTDGGTTYQGQLLAHNQTRTSQYGTAGVDQITEFSRPFASRTWNGTKLFFGFFDTDTATWGVFNNVNPDLRLIGYDVATQQWTADLSNLQAVNGGENITAGSNADGSVNFGSGSYYTIDNGGSYSVPVVYTIPGLNPGDPCSNYYINCAAPSTPFSYAGHSLSVPVVRTSPLCQNGSGVVLSTQDLQSDLQVSSNYPNPFNGKTFVDVTLMNASDVTIEISNVVGQTLNSTQYKNMHAGMNTISLDASTLSEGIYFYSVKSKNSVVTRTMTVKIK